MKAENIELRNYIIANSDYTSVEIQERYIHSDNDLLKK